MTLKRSIYKVPNGKLLKVSLEPDGNKIGSVKIMGDFFVYPEERIEELEKHLLDTKIEEENLQHKVESFFKDNPPATLFGVDIPSIVHGILEAYKS